MKDVYDWDSGRYLGKIKEAKHTYNVVGNMNEHQLIIGETTYGGISFLQSQPHAVLDYGTLIWTTLQRATNAREAIRVMGELVAENGYASEGESFSIADPNEVWVLEMIGKGANDTGAVWVAVRIPDGHVCAHANQARITTFPKDDPENAIYSPDVIDFARKHGLYNGTDDAFSFSDVYDPVTAVSTRICEARVWSFFRTVTDGMEVYLDYLQGLNLTHRMPLSIPVNNKISVNETMWHMRTHNEGSWFDNTLDEGAGAFHSPYRWRPLEWTSGGNTYLNERTVATQQTGWHFVAQARKWLPNAIGGIIWFSVDDSATSVHVPFYSSITKVPRSWAHPDNDASVNGDLTKFSFDSAFWVFSMVAELCYNRWSIIYPEVAQRISQLESSYIEQTQEIEKVALEMHRTGKTERVVQLLTEFSNTLGDKTTRDWLSFWQYLFAKYHDGQITVPDKTQGSCNCRVQQTGYDQVWYKRIVQDTGAHYEVVTHEEDAIAENAPQTVSKLRFA